MEPYVCPGCGAVNSVDADELCSTCPVCPHVPELSLDVEFFCRACGKNLGHPTIARCLDCGCKRCARQSFCEDDDPERSELLAAAGREGGGA